MDGGMTPDTGDQGRNAQPARLGTRGDGGPMRDYRAAGREPLVLGMEMGIEWDTSGGKPVRRAMGFHRGATLSPAPKYSQIPGTLDVKLGITKMAEGQ